MEWHGKWLVWTSFNLEVVTHLEDPGKKIRVFLYNTTRDRVELAITSDQLLKNQDLWEGMKVNTREFLNYMNSMSCTEVQQFLVRNEVNRALQLFEAWKNQLFVDSRFSLTRRSSLQVACHAGI